MIIVTFPQSRRDDVCQLAIQFAQTWSGKMLVKFKSPVLEYDIASSDIYDEGTAIDKMVECGLINPEVDQWEIL